MTMEAQKTTIDYLRFRVQEEPPAVLEALRPMFGTLGGDLAFKHLPRGSMGFQQASQIVIEDMPLARLDFGGDSQRGWVRTELTGKGCEWVQDWNAVQGLEELHQAQIRRLDIALTTWDGEITHERVCQAHAERRFQNGGRPPELQQITSSNDRAGRTCYVGKRTSDKFFRSYEKGFELLNKLSVRFGMLAGASHIDGKRVEDIYRCELELKASATTIEWDVIGRRDQYFAGAYPFCADVLPGIQGDTLMRRKERDPQTTVIAAAAMVKLQMGRTLRTLLHCYGGDEARLLKEVLSEPGQYNQAMLEAGVLLVDHT
jgi:DNA relaxase NicK